MRGLRAVCLQEVPQKARRDYSRERVHTMNNIIWQAITRLFPDLAHDRPLTRPNRIGREATAQKRSRRRMGATKASHAESKTRRKMAAKSNRINRKNIKGWRY